MSAPAQPSTLDRLLRPFADVRAGEGVTALLLSANVFVLLTCYSVLKPVREALILGQGSAEIKSYTAAGQVLVLAAVVPLYGRLADRVPRRRLINVVTAIFTGCLLLFYGLAWLAVPLGIVFYIWLGIFSLMLVAQFWAFANDVYSKEEGERLFPIVAFGASLGAVLGAGIASVLIAPLGVYQMMLVAAVLLVAQVQLTNYVDGRERRLKEVHLAPAESSASLTATTGSLRIEDVERMLAEHDARKAGGDAQGGSDRADAGDTGAAGTGGADAAPDHGASPTGAFRLVFRVRYLLAIGVMMMLLNLVNTTGEYILARVVAANAEAAVAAGTAGGLSVESFIGAFYANFQLVVNLVGVLVQLFLVSRIVKYLGVRIAVLVLPVISLGAYSLIAFYPVLGYIRWAKTAENATDYSLNNTVRNMLFLPTTREQKYKAKQAIDSFFVRVGDTLSAVLVFIGTQVVVLSAAGFAMVNGAIVVVWLLLAGWIGREYQRLVDAGETPA
jgi:AAA family ATP:ADP antiporter